MVMSSQTTVGLGEKLMQTKYGMEFSETTYKDYKKLLINMIYKLLPLREEQQEWEKYLDSLILELHGLDNLFTQIDSLSVIRLLSKLDGLKELNKDSDFYLYRKIVFECTNLIK